MQPGVPYTVMSRIIITCTVVRHCHFQSTQAHKFLLHARTSGAGNLRVKCRSANASLMSGVADADWRRFYKIEQLIQSTCACSTVPRSCWITAFYFFAQPSRLACWNIAKRYFIPELCVGSFRPGPPTHSQRLAVFVLWPHYLAICCMDRTGSGTVTGHSGPSGE